jgi:single-stranded DNA-binding protein
MAYGKQINFDGNIFPASKDEGFALAFSSAGNAWLRFSVSVYQGKNEDGSYKDSLWMRCVVFGDMAENVAESVKPGDPVIVVGTLRPNNWTDNDGNEHNDVTVFPDLIGLDISRFPATSQKMWSDKSQPGAAAPAPAAKTPTGPDQAPF